MVLLLRVKSKKPESLTSYFHGELPEVCLIYLRHNFGANGCMIGPEGSLGMVLSMENYLLTIVAHHLNQLHSVSVRSLVPSIIGCIRVPQQVSVMVIFHYGLGDMWVKQCFRGGTLAGTVSRLWT